MFKHKEVIEKLNSIDEQLKKVEGYGLQSNNQIFTMAKSMRELLTLNMELTKTVDTLNKIIQGNVASAESCELFVTKNYRKAPMVYKDGELYSSENIKSMVIRYDKGERATVEIEVE